MAQSNKININAKNENDGPKYPFFVQYQTNIENHGCSNQSAQENGRKYMIDNKSKKEIVKYKIDGGLLTDQDALKCDYGFYTEDDFIYFVELKGSDYSHAIDQIINTIRLLIEKHNIKVSKVNARIVVSKLPSPELRSSNEKKLKRILDSYGKDENNLKKQTRQLTDVL